MHIRAKAEGIRKERPYRLLRQDHCNDLMPTVIIALKHVVWDLSPFGPSVHTELVHYHPVLFFKFRDNVVAARLWRASFFETYMGPDDIWSFSG